MAARPHTLQEARATYGSNVELWWWVFMRVSGLLMILILGGHVFMTNIMINVGDVDFEFVSSRLSTPWLKIFNTALLVLAMLHGANGIRYSIEDYASKPGRRFVGKIILYALAVIVMLFGLISLWGIDYTQYDTAAAVLLGVAA